MNFNRALTRHERESRMDPSGTPPQKTQKGGGKKFVIRDTKENVVM
jgi:hypothetical protein